MEFCRETTILSCQRHLAEASFIVARHDFGASQAQKENRMQIASVGSMSNMVPMAKTSEGAEAPGPDHDGDSDDKATIKSATAPGVGTLLDTSA